MVCPRAAMPGRGLLSILKPASSEVDGLNKRDRQYDDASNGTANLPTAGRGGTT